ncbi:MAG: hypothetical protein V4850_03420 [Myxococcota bacterium]
MRPLPAVVLALAAACTGRPAFVCPAAPVVGAEQVLAPGRVVLLGEMHGTTEAPDIAGRLACQAAAAGHAVSLGLEVPTTLQPALDTPPRTLAAATALMADPFWLRADQDGRSSVAMRDLILRVGEWRTDGADITLFAFDIGRGEPGERDAWMAERVRREANRRQEGVVVALVGNIHPRRGPHAAEGLDFTPMGAHLDALGSRLVSLDLAHSGGTAWACYSGEGCQKKLLGGRDRGPTQFVELFGEPDRRGFDGSYYVGPIAASPPARSR